MKNTILFISNGHGEDMIATAIIKELRQRSMVHGPWSILALPLVGKGTAYKDLNVPTLVEGKPMPSGGFVMTARDLWQDIRAGWLGLTWQQWKALWTIRQQVKTVVAIGDTYPLLLSLFCRKKTRYFLSTAKSSFVGDHNRLELFLMKKYTRRVFTRDGFTADYLREYGIAGDWVGNVMMDCLDLTGENFYIKENDRVIGILPGSREEAYANLDMISQVLTVLRQRKGTAQLLFLVAKVPSLDLQKLERILEYAEDVIISEKFGDVLSQSEVVIGLSGTANEQAIGLGKPVVAFPGSGPQTSHYRFRLQRRLLGGGITLVDEFDPEKVADTVLSLLVDSRKKKEIKRIGMERMGQPGAAKRMAEILLNGNT